MPNIKIQGQQLNKFAKPNSNKADRGYLSPVDYKRTAHDSVMPQFKGGLAPKGDFGKHVESNEIPKINLVWDSIPMQLAKENKKFFTEEVWNSISLFFRKCTTDKEFILFRDFTKDYPTAETVKKWKEGGQ